MDERLRRLERSDDSRDHERAGRLRCKIEGHLTPAIRGVTSYQDIARQMQVYTIALEDDRRYNVTIKDSVLYAVFYGGATQELDQFKYDLAYAALALSKCGRCGEETGMEDEYLKCIHTEIL